MSIDRNRRRLLAAGLAGAGMAAFPATAALAGSETAVRAALHTFPLPEDGGRLVGRRRVGVVGAGETLLDVARRYDVGHWDMVLANPGMDVLLPGTDRPVVIPSRFILPDAPREGLVVNVPELRLYYYPPPAGGEAAQVVTHPVGIGRQDWSTPLGLTRIVEKIPEPAWYPPRSIREEAAARGESLPAVVEPGPDNPLGDYALILDIDGYLIHGTNRPEGVGMRISHGCMRLFPEDIESLFPQVPRGTPVRLVDQPYKLAWADGRLWQELHPMPGQGDFLRIERGPHRAMLRRMQRELIRVARARGVELDPVALLDYPPSFSGMPEPLPMGRLSVGDRSRRLG